VHFIDQLLFHEDILLYVDLWRAPRLYPLWSGNCIAERYWHVPKYVGCDDLTSRYQK
jgi:hypothetical protein